MYFNHDKLECYAVALDVARWAARVKVPTGRKHLRDQLVTRRSFFDIAMGSAAEVGAIIDLLGEDAAKKSQVLRVAQMAARLR